MGLKDRQGREIEAKQYFPHKFNKPENYLKCLKILPPIENYYYQNWKKSDRLKFVEWYVKTCQEMQNDPNSQWRFGNKLLEYNTNDVDILLHAVIKTRAIFKGENLKFFRNKYNLDLTKTDDYPDGDEMFLHCSTIASACSRYNRIKHVKPDTIAITPEGGYERNDRQSKIANKYIRYSFIILKYIKT